MPTGEEIIEKANHIFEFGQKEEFYKQHLRGKILVDPHKYVVIAKNSRFKVGLFLFHALKAYHWLRDHTVGLSIRALNTRSEKMRNHEAP